jgi:hypothetical protein
MSLMLTQLIWYTGNLVDLRGLSKSSCLANFTSNNALLDSEELVVVNVDAAEPTDIKGDKETLFFMDAEQK